MTTLATETNTEAGAGDSLMHIYCCDPDVSLCGLDISDFAEDPDGDEDECIVCADIEDSPCLVCGAPYEPKD